jgi:hypothetical protein
MSTSVFIARLVGPVMLVIGLAVLANQSEFADVAEEFMASRALLFLSGLITMPVGIAIVLTHNIWTADWRVMITLFGWVNAIGGALRLLAPQLVLRVGDTVLKQPQFTAIAAAIWVTLGLLFCFFGYLHRKTIISGREHHYE